MSVVIVPEPPKPRPGLLKGIGVLNLLIGVFLLAWSAGSIYLLVPFLTRNDPLQLDPHDTQLLVDELRRQMVETIKQQENRGGSETQRKVLHKARVELEASDGKIGDQVDFHKINEHLPWVSRYLWADTLSLPVLNVFMFASGLGLLRKKEWARRLALSVAWLKIVRLFALNLMLGIVVVPHVQQTAQEFVKSEFGQRYLKWSIENMNNQPGQIITGGTKLSPEDFVRVLGGLGQSFALMNFAFGAIYPAIVLVVLSRRGARVACQ